MVGSILAVGIIYTKFYDFIPNFFRNLVVIAIAILAAYSSFYKCAAMIVMTYFPFHLLLVEYSGSFNFAELYSILNLNAVFVIYWVEKWIDFTCIFKDIPDKYENKLELLLSVRPTTTGYLPEILLFFSPYIILNIAALMFITLMWASNRRMAHYIFKCLVLSVFIMLAIVFISNWISPFSFNVVYFLVHQ